MLSCENINLIVFCFLNKCIKTKKVSDYIKFHMKTNIQIDVIMTVIGSIYLFLG